jgi:hypothetical protein
MVAGLTTLAPTVVDVTGPANWTFVHPDALAQALWYSATKVQ